MDEELAGLVDELLGHVRSMIPRLTSRSDRQELEGRHYAAACLARSNRLLSGMVVLSQSDHPDVVGLGLRPILECWYLGMYLLLAAAEAIVLVRGSFLHQLERLDDSWEIPHLELLQSFVETRRLRWDLLAQRVGQLMVEKGDDADGALCERMYEVVYRAESALSVHGGLGVFMGHVVIANPALGIREVSVDGFSSSKRVAMAANLDGTLARGVSIAFGMSHAKLDDIGRRLEVIRRAQADDS